MPTSYTVPSENATSFTKPSASDFTSGSSARLTTEAKVSVMRLSKDSEFTFYSKPAENATSFTKPAES